MNEENKKGTMHPLSLLAQEAYDAFSEMGFEIATGPELESEWYNFDVLNVPKDHPARDMQDTFFIKDKKDYVLRTHTTSVTAQAVEKAGKEGKIPCAFISIGKIFRNEATDTTHEMEFYQIDGVMVGNISDSISIANLKGVLTQFYKKILGEDVEIEFRPSFFPFTEPSLEVFAKFRGKWLELGGSGMLHPNVLRNVGLDPAKVQGFAFGLGFDRIAMVKWGIPDVRFFYQGDLRLNQF
jgi:phenylalanyl-tRNA synthetase alpha chain